MVSHADDFDSTYTRVHTQVLDEREANDASRLRILANLFSSLTSLQVAPKERDKNTASKTKGRWSVHVGLRLCLCLCLFF